MDQNFLPLLFGGDINVYSVARAFHQEYGIKAIAYGKYYTFPCAHSQIIDYRICRENDTPDAFLKNVQTVCAEHPDKTVLVMGCGDNYIQLAADHRDQLPENAIAPYIPGDMMRRLIDKEQFYNLCDQYDIPHPHTFVHRQETGHDFTLPFGAPYIAKPADGVDFWAHEFEGIEKVFLCDSWERLLEVLDATYASGYSGAMILQEFIPGDDTNMRVLTSYSDRDGQVNMMCLGHVLLEEHSPHGIGNHAAILREHNEELCLKMKGLLESLGYVGFSNFDIKYDPRDGQYKAFELNCRQGRSNYYVTGGGNNVAKLVVEDRVLGQKKELEITKNKAFWTMLPLWLALRYIPKKYHGEIKSLVRQGAATNSLFYTGDASLERRLRRRKNQLGHIKRFFQFNKRPQD